ncbi:MAG: hypothetical protein GY863_22005 [bacterium]|nr:hypothetical protein [bacterium]
MSEWLQNFAYRIDIGVGIFVTSGACALLLAIITVSYHAIKAANSNPVNSLRHE